VPQHDDANIPALELGQERHRGQRQGRNGPAVLQDRHLAEEDVADDPVSDLGDERRPDGAAGA
jgi:hypothetical protein